MQESFIFIYITRLLPDNGVHSTDITTRQLLTAFDVTHRLSFWSSC